MHDYDRYARDVLAGRVVAGELVACACRRYLADLERTDVVRFEPDRAAHALKFVGFLRHSKGREWAGRPIEIQPWQAFIVANLFGWVWRSTGRRRYRISYIQIARKNGKTTLAAALALYWFVADGEPGAEVYAAATKLEQAMLCWREARNMARSSGLERELRLSIGVSNMADPGTGSKFEPLPADADSLDGLNTHAAIVDEVHAHRTPELWDVIETSTEARTDPHLCAITTAGVQRQSICKRLRDHSEAVLRGTLTDDELFAYIAEPDKDDDWGEPIAWAKANPNLGITIEPERLARKAARARAVLAFESNFRTKHCNQWVQQADRAIDLVAWNACDAVAWALEGRRAYGGLDLGEVRDLSAFVLVFPPEGEDAEAGAWGVLAWFWMPADNVEGRVHRDRVPYDSWIRDGWIRTTPGNVQDHAYIVADLLGLAAQYEIVEIGYDPYKSLEVILRLSDESIRVEPVRQGHQTLAEPFNKVLQLVHSGRLGHRGNPVLRWMAGNVVAKPNPEGNLKPDKGASFERIDGISALCNALARAIANPTAGRSVYDDRGIDSF